MRFWKAILGLARKKFVGPPVAVAAIGLALAAYFLMPSRYVSTASMVLTVPATGGTLETEPASKPGLTNPLLQFNDALRTTAGILILATNRADVYKEIGAPENGSTVVTINDGRTNPDLLSISTNGPFIYVEVEGDDPATVREVMRKAQQRVRLELGRRQTELDAPISTHIGIMDVMPPSGPRAALGDRLTFAAFGGVFGLIAGIGVAYGVQRVRWSRAAPAAEPAPVQEEPEVWSEVVAEQPVAESEATEKLNGSRPHPPSAVSGFPMSVAELATEETGPIQVIRLGDGAAPDPGEKKDDTGTSEDGDGQLDSTT
ncbi:hypothetical protein [Nonomuraea gerenzanensis]|uniref:Capsular polysaccharide biosynthesis protein n=1 Tax=Nonomuraea gerenzanensis TaxID=93944 RepID=A0A1M4DYH7_9ACTN|nr:hypothetical protein [Nonomuraea gerenzanensis]UBU13944.1 hypothetical protein LCN96_02590 [Nonomuraea gerenzanensis]SBO91628.1 hypothetical protein BN4615_P1142 [Nonomuraea gerenzanensis]